MRTPRIRSFAPIADRRARVLILGSMPGRESLKKREYYAHPRNLFWRIVGDLFGIEPTSPYMERIQALKSLRIAVWDVLQSCVREGSMDSGIDDDSEISNDFRNFFRTHGKITRVFFNGAKAEASFNRHVPPDIDGGGLRYIRLPSTSPANASMTYEQKLNAWRAGMRGKTI